MKFPQIKQWYAISVILFLLFLPSCENHKITEPLSQIDNKLNSINEEVQEPSHGIVDEAQYIVLEHKLMPPSELNEDSEFWETYSELVDAIDKKNLLALDGFLDDDIIVSFGGKKGKLDFYEEWELNDNPELSKVWAEIERTIQLGGIFNVEEKAYVAPYIYINFPNEFDTFEHLAITNKDVHVYEKEDIDSDVIDILCYNIVKRKKWDSGFWTKTDQDFIQIETISGRIGYVQKQYIRSPSDYRFSIKCNNNGEWKIIYMISGD
ncbi:MAG: hypothetical protein LBH09_04435 [Peptococcaceae bacterium]|nr:hypothetical protein [Peptococcaceae bacterium]